MTDILDRTEPSVSFDEIDERIAELTAQLAIMFAIPEPRIKDIIDHAITSNLDRDEEDESRRIRHAKTPRYGKRQAAAVRYAANSLDKIEPGWERKIRPWTILIRHEEHCVLGQIFGDYINGLHAYCWTASTCPGGVHVFIGENPIDRHFIKKAWRREIRARR